MANSRLQLAAIGHQDRHLTGNPQISYFKSVYKRHTNFMIQKKKVAFNADVVFDNTNTATLEKYGDLLYDMALVTQFNKITVTGGDVISYTNAIGHSMIKEVSIKIGGYVIDRQPGEWLHIQKELTTPESQRENYNRMIGQNPLLGYGYYIGDPSGNHAKELRMTRREFIGENFDASGNTSGLDHTITPLKFWFCKNSYNAIPIISLKNHQVEVDLILRPFKELFIRRNATFTSFNITNDSNITAGSIIADAYLLCDYIFLDEDEKHKFILRDQEYLITQVQKTETQIPQPSSTGTSSTIKLDFNNPVTELFWVVQRSDVSTYNEWFNYSNKLLTNNHFKTTGTGVDDKAIPPIQKAKLIFNGKDRTLELNQNFYGRYENLRNHTSAPESFIYTYSFALNPENHKQPSGTANFSRINTASLKLTYNNITDSNIDVRIYALNYNIFKVINGMGGILYNV